MSKEPQTTSMLEKMCRIICKGEGVDPDQESVGIGCIIPVGQTYKLWEARKRVAEALISEGYRGTQMSNPQTPNIALLGSAYKSLVENCVFQQNSNAHKEGIRVLKSIGDLLEIEPTDQVKKAFEVLNERSAKDL